MKEGIQELDGEKLALLLHLKYNDSLADAVAGLGKPEKIGTVFSGSKNTSTNRRLPQ